MNELNRILRKRNYPPHKPRKRSTQDLQEYLFFLDRYVNILTNFENESVVETVEYTKGQTIAFAEYFEVFTGSWMHIEHVWPGTWGHD